jgi:TetR/AcrR family transcriptional regulator, transcriptional repressor for nem operon
MTKNNTDKRSRLIQTAVELVYRQGFQKTTLADIAQEAEVPLGNVYYYFKTKDAIGEAIVEQRLSQFEAKLEDWNKAASPKDRLCKFIQNTFTNRGELARGGCQFGSLCAELQKAGGPLAKKANRLFAIPLKWIEKQFRALGKGANSPGMALHLMSALQGVALLANSFRNPKYVASETNHLKDWVRAL